ncbi:PREDICTED: putative golgin subfamily A member 8F/8G [Cercocebus atys]|uniref:Golgin subfamily A conserved domain-containing protein n=1 Tax=Cercocebus atys TaxID=9531 RepID=A0A2K5L417_CERAT|nr:PREDICTED: putative golgin subfamily A member 8F/8G [Cercocebus atys]
MAEETRQSILAEAKKKLKEYWQRNSPGGPAGVKKNRKTNGSSPETATSGGSHSPGDSATGIDREGPTSSAPLKDLESPSQELAAVLDSRFVKISRLNNIIKSLERQKKQVEHQLEEEKKANNEKQKTERELEVQIQRLNVQKKKLTIDVYRTKRSLIYFEEECKDLAGRLQQTLQCIEELEQALSAVPATQEEKEISSSSHRKACMEWKLEWSTREQALLKAQLTQMKDSLKQAHLEREEYAQHLKGERAQWQQRMRKMWQEVCTLKKEKKDDTHRVEELKRSLSKLKHQMAKPLPPEPPAVPAEEELQHLRKELERVSAELQAHVENHQHVSLLNQPQKERLGRQEERLRKQEEKLPQLAEPQSGVEELNNENKSALQSEQQVEELQETLDEERLEASSQQSQQLNAPLNLTALPGEGDGGEHLGSAEEEAPQPMPSLPEDLESWEAMSGCMDHREEMADLSELVEKPELPFIEYWGERCHQNVHQLLTEAGGSAEDAAMGGGHHRAGPAQGGDEGGAAGDAITACADHNNEHSKLLTSSQNPAHEPRPGVPDPQELGAAHKHGDLCEVSLTVSAETGQGEAREGSPHDNPTAQPIAQEQQEHPGLGSNLCVPFFCWAWLRRRRR